MKTSKTSASLLLLTIVAAPRCGGGGGGVAIDAAPPTSTLAFPGFVGLTDEASVAASGRSTDDSGVAAVDVDGVAATTTDDFASWSATRLLKLGTNPLTVRATDRRGNREAASSDGEVVRVETMLSGPDQIAIDPVAGAAIVCDSIAQGLLAIDLRSGKPKRITDPFLDDGPALTFVLGFTIDPAAQLGWVLRHRIGGDPDVVEVDLATGRRTLLSDDADPGPVLEDASDVAVDVKNRRLLLSVSDPTGLEGLVAVDLKDGARKEFSVAGDGQGPDPVEPRALAIDAANSRALVLDVDPAGTKVLEVKLASGDRRVLSGPGIGGGADLDRDATRIGVSSDGATAFVLQPFVAQLVAIDLATGDRSILSDATHGGGPSFGFQLDVDVDPKRERPIVSDAFLAGLFAVDPTSGDRSTFGVAPSLGAGPSLLFPRALAADFPRQRAFDLVDEGVVAVDLRTGARSLVASNASGTDLDLDAPRERLLFLTLSALSAVDPGTGAFTALSDATHGSGPLMTFALRMAVDGGRGRAWLVDFDASFHSRVLEVDLATGDRSELSGPTRGGGAPQQIASAVVHDATRGRLIVADEPGLVAIDLATGDRSLLAVLPEPGTPPLTSVRNLEISADGRSLFVAASVEDADGRLDPAVFRVDLERERSSLVTSNSTTPRRLGPPMVSIDDLVFDAASGALRAVDNRGLWAIDVATGERVIASH